MGPALSTPARTAWSACSGSTRRPTGRTRCTAATATYTETNCYTDILIELLHARGDEPLAALGLHAADGLRGRPVDVLQAAPERPRSAVRRSTSTRCSRTGRCPSRSPSRSRRGRTMIVELDSWYLPDTAATSYRTRAREDSVVARGDRPRGRAAALLPQRRRSTSSSGEDYRGVFRLGREFSGDVLPPVHRARPLRRRPAAARATSCASAAREAAAPRTRAPPGRRTRSSASAPQLDARPAAAARGRRSATTTPTRSRPCGWPARRSRSARSHVDWLLGDAGAGAVGALRRDRRRLQGALVQARPPPRRSTRSRLVARAGGRLGARRCGRSTPLTG